ncbi:AAA family ATPase [Caulobacter segnis]
MGASKRNSPVHRYILTGAPGAGKTVLLRALERAGHAVVEEAATDVIALAQAEGVAEPWTDPSFIDAIVALQRQRETRAAGEVVFFDRSPVCALALARFLGHPVSDLLRAELARIAEVYQRRVFLVRGLGFVTPTAARRISLEDALRFEAVHEAAYAELGYELIPIAPGPTAERTAAVLARITEA